MGEPYTLKFRVHRVQCRPVVKRKKGKRVENFDYKSKYARRHTLNYSIIPIRKKCRDIKQ